MNSALARTAGLTFLLLAGCQSYAPYGTPGAFPGVYAPPQAYPSGTFVQPGMTPAQPGTPQNPMTYPGTPGYGQPANPSSIPDSNPGTFREDGPIGSRSTPGYQEKLPPQYEYDPGAASIGRSGSPPISGSSGREQTPNAFPSERPLEANSDSRPFESSRRSGTGSDTRSFDTETEPFKVNPGEDSNQPGADPEDSSFDPFDSSERSQSLDAPARLTSADAVNPIVAVSHSRNDNPSATRPNPYAHDRANYTWLRGVVDQDEKDGSWQLIYSLTPDRADRYGGSVTLQPGPQLSILRPQDVVLVEGRFHENEKDAVGKPVYSVDHLARLVPRRTP